MPAYTTSAGWTLGYEAREDGEAVEGDVGGRV